MTKQKSTGYRNGLIIASVVTALSMNSANAEASGCNRVVTKNINFAKGAVCWTYRGKATEFVGRFSRGQTVSVTMTGEATYMGANGKITRRIEPRSVSVSGPRNFFDGESGVVAQGAFQFTVPTTGKYSFSFTPCFMWGGVGDVSICAQ